MQLKFSYLLVVVGIVFKTVNACATNELPGIPNTNNAKYVKKQISSKNGGNSILWKSNFDLLPALTEWQIKKIFFGTSNYQFVQDEAGNFKHILRVAFPKGSWSPINTAKSGMAVGGLGFVASCGIVPQDKLHLRYYVRFPSKFNFVKGGKLPGLYGGKGNSGGDQPDGTDGFSSRLMWRRNGDGEVYAYLPGSENKWGTSIGRGNWRFEPGRWYMLEQAVILNSPGKNDGEIRLWVNEKLVIEQKKLRFRDVSQLKLDGIMFSTFFGGNDQSWATPVTTYIDFAGFALGTDYIGPGGSQIFK